MGFLLPSAKPEVRCHALECILGLSNSGGGRPLVIKSEVLDRVILLMADSNDAIAKYAHTVIVNLSAYESVQEELMTFVPAFLQQLQDPQWVHVDKLCTILSNLSRTIAGAKGLMSIITKDQHNDKQNTQFPIPTLYQLVEMFNIQSRKEEYHYLANVFRNLSQLAEARFMFLDHSKCLLPLLLPHIHSIDSSIRRGGIVGLCKNLCFEVGQFLFMTCYAIL